MAEEKAGEPGNDRRRQNLFTLQEFRDYCSDFISRKGFHITEAVEAAGYANANSYYRAVNQKGSDNPFFGLQQLIKTLECLGYEITFYIQVIDKVPPLQRESLDPDLKLFKRRKKLNRTLRRQERRKQQGK